MKNIALSVRAYSRYLAIVAAGASIAMIVASAGCAGRKVATADTCDSTLSNATVTIQYPERSRSSSMSALSSALSARLVITGAATGGGDVTVSFNRDPSKLAAHAETYNLPSLTTGNFSATLTLYSDVNEGGVVVGSATATDNVTCSGHTFASVTLTGNAASVAVTPVSIAVGGPATQLDFVVKDSSNAVIPVSPGSAIFTGNGAAATVTKDGIATPVSAGTIQVTAAVDGITSPSATITITSASTPSYRLVDLGATTAFTQGRPLNDNGLALVKTADGLNALVVNVNTLATTQIGQSFLANINDSDLVVTFANGISQYYQGPGFTSNNFSGTDSVRGVNSLGNCIGTTSASQAVYWSSTTVASTPLGSVSGDPNKNVIPESINSSGLIVGGGFVNSQFEACYFPSPSAGQATLLPALSSGRSYAYCVNDSGATVGYADSGNNELAVIWDTPTSAPRDLGNLGTSGDADAYGINNSGEVVGIDAKAPTSNRAFLYTPANGMQSLYDLCDNTRTGWQLQVGYCINNNGWVYGTGMLGGVSHTFVAVPTP